MTAYVKPDLMRSRAALQEIINSNPDRVQINEPSPFSFKVYTPKQMKVGSSVTITNHPKRSKFYKLERVSETVWRVS